MSEVALNAHAGSTVLTAQNRSVNCCAGLAHCLMEADVTVFKARIRTSATKQVTDEFWVRSGFLLLLRLLLELCSPQPVMLISALGLAWVLKLNLA